MIQFTDWSVKNNFQKPKEVNPRAIKSFNDTRASIFSIESQVETSIEASVYRYNLLLLIKRKPGSFIAQFVQRDPGK